MRYWPAKYFGPWRMRIAVSLLSTCSPSPGRGYLDDTGIRLCADKGTKIVTIKGDNDPSLGNRKVVHRWILNPATVHVVSDVFNVKVFVKPGK
jgi:hypothetical protein